MNSIIAISLGALVGGFATSMYYAKRINSIMESYLDTKTVNKLLREHTSKTDEKKSSKNKGYKRPAKKRSPKAIGESKKS
jgi:hypothetical protein|tara:strand:+ start:3294 stop:3533 length:240 start_codon:yes stop_codon:yes gene_type:complete